MCADFRSVSETEDANPLTSIYEMHGPWLVEFQSLPICEIYCPNGCLRRSRGHTLWGGMASQLCIGTFVCLILSARGIVEELRGSSNPEYELLLVVRKGPPTCPTAARFHLLYPCCEVPQAMDAINSNTHVEQSKWQKLKLPRTEKRTTAHAGPQPSAYGT